MLDLLTVITDVLIALDLPVLTDGGGRLVGFASESAATVSATVGANIGLGH